MAKKSSKSSKKKAKVADPLYPSKPRNFRIGNDILPQQRDLGRYVKWPRYVRIQRQKKIILQRLKVPPSINQFSHTLDKNQATDVFKLLMKYRPESRVEKRARLQKIAEEAVKDPKAKIEPKKSGPTVCYGLKHVTSLVENKKAQLVLIASDVDPIELVVWLPALCRKMDVPYCIVKNKGRLGTIVHQKKATAVAVVDVNEEDKATLKKLADICREEFNNNMAVLKEWGGGIMGLKTQAKLSKREAFLAAEAAKKAKMLM